MKKVLILGVNGFIGHHLSKRILDTTDWEVYGMDMYSERVTDLMDNPPPLVKMMLDLAMDYPEYKETARKVKTLEVSSGDYYGKGYQVL